MDTLDLLLEVLDEYEGTILLVSHDRDFLNKITTSMLYLKGDGSVIEHVGNYEELYEKYVKSGQKTDRKTPDAPKKEPVKEPEKQSGKSPRLSYKDQRLYEVLPNEISAIEKEIQTIEQTLSDPALFTADTDKFYALTEKLQSLQILKDEKETKWLEIEMQISMM